MCVCMCVCVCVCRERERKTQCSDLCQPLLDQASGVSWPDGTRELDHFALGRFHSGDDLLRREGQLSDALEALLQMWLDTERVLGLGQDLQKFVVGEEEEPGR